MLKIAGIKQGLPLAGRWLFWAIIIAIVGGLIGVAGGVIAYRNRRQLWHKFRNRNNVVLSPKDIALAKLTKLTRNIKGSTQHQIALYDTLSDILREYLGRTFETGFLECTTEECIACLNRMDIDQETIKRINTLLERCDHAKFASRYDANQITDTIQRCEALVNRIDTSFWQDPNDQEMSEDDPSKEERV